MTDIDYTLFEDLSARFDQHIKEGGNDRILFSGPFGVGKSTFLEYFFNQETVEDRFTPIFLSPIDYSILNNEDVIKYVKYDLLIKLVEKFPQQFEEIYISMLSATEVFLQHNYADLIISLSLLAPGYGKQAYQFLRIVESKLGELKELKRKAESKLEVASKYMANLDAVNGSLYEQDEATSLIEKILIQVADDKETVLIIDDIDRIDPHHIFRLFNVFSAHLRKPNKRGARTKFGFDKVVFVCDEENIRELYKSLYGISVDYNGYIDKFFSKRIFYFNNSHRLKAKIDSVITSLKLESADINVYNRLNDNRSQIRPFLTNFFELAIQLNLITIRTLEKSRRSSIQIASKLLRHGTTGTIRSGVKNSSIELLLVFDLITAMCGSPERVEEVLKIIMDQNKSFDFDHKYFVLDALMLIESEVHSYKRSFRFTHTIEPSSGLLQLQISPPSGHYQQYSAHFVEGKTSVNQHRRWFFPLLLMAYQKVREMSYF